MKIEDFDDFKDIPIDEIDENELVDIRTLEIRTDLPPKERMEDILKKMKNPYIFKVGEYVVKTKFAGEDGLTIAECFEALLMM